MVEQSQGTREYTVTRLVLSLLELSMCHWAVRRKGHPSLLTEMYSMEIGPSPQLVPAVMLDLSLAFT